MIFAQDDSVALRNIEIDRARESLDNGRNISKNICQGE